MKRRISISLYLDVRYKLKTGRFPVKLQCNAKENGKWRQIYLLTGEELTKDEWERIMGQIGFLNPCTSICYLKYPFFIENISRHALRI